MNPHTRPITIGSFIAVVVCAFAASAAEPSGVLRSTAISAQLFRQDYGTKACRVREVVDARTAE